MKTSEEKKSLDASKGTLHIAKGPRDTMKRLVVLLIAALMLPIAAVVPLVSASGSSLVDGGYTQENEPSFVYWKQMYDGSILTVDTTGNLSVNSFVSGFLIPQWTIDLNVSANSARLDSAQQLTVVCHDSGVLIVHMDLQIANRNISTLDAVNDADWDDDGDLWLAYYAGRRRAEEIDSEGPTGVVSPQISTGFNGFEVLSDGRVVVGAYDKKVYVSGNDGTFLRTLTDSTAIVNTVMEDHNEDLIVGTANGKLFRYNTTSWTVETLSLTHGSSIVSIEEFDNSTYHIGTQNGRLTQVDVTGFSEGETYASSGRVIGSLQAFTGELYIVTSTATSSKIRLYDLDTDGDGVTDQVDLFPFEFTQWEDADGDGYGDNPNGYLGDVFPTDITQWADADGDGYGDNADGTDGDAFPNNIEQWTDSDGDGFGDNANGMEGDKFKFEPSQWFDTDQDGYGDNPEGITPDSCPTANGFSKFDRFGCLDSDLDGYSNPTDSWTVTQGADALPEQGTQWRDGDGDGYGDNITGLLPDSCNWKAGTSTKAWIVNITADIGYIEVPSYGCEDADGDGWVDVTESQNMDLDPNEYFDGDNDGVGSNSDYDDTRPLIQTEEDHCMLNFDDTSLACQGWRSSEYQSYVSRDKSDNESDLSFAAWNTSKNAGLLDTNKVDSNTVKQVAMVGGGAFLLLTVIIIIVGVFAKRRKMNSLVKMYGVPFIPTENKSAENEALEGTAGLSAQGGIISDSSWDDEIESLDFSAPQDGIEEEESPSNVIDAESLYGGEESLESIAGIETEAAPSPVPTPAAAPAPETPVEAPPLPPGGLPEGWTTDQWKWYGQEWLDKNQ
tara:strand:+ start:17039 stop:19552 length:2514 start_codon:yes stop_codon:yes gene_type:complete